MTRRGREVDKLRQALPGQDCPVTLRDGAPAARGELGAVVMATPNGRRRAWWLRCPWCRNMVEVPAAKLRIQGRTVELEGELECPQCRAAYLIQGGIASRIAGERPSC